MTSSPSSREAPDRKRASLSRELGELLIELSIGVHRYAMYPAGHPSLTPVAENIIARLARYFEDRDRLTIGVAQDQLVIEGVATDTGHPVLSDLARRLHDHQLGALSLKKGVKATQIEDLLDVLSEESEDDETPLGRRKELPTWQHITLHPLGYDRLEMREGEETSEEEPDRAMALWLGLAQAAMAAEEPYSPNDAPDERVVAEQIADHEREKAYDQVIVGYLLQLAEELKGDTRGESARVRERVSRLIEELDPETLERLVEMGGDPSRRQRFILDANQTLTVEAVMKLLRSAAAASEQTISDSMVRLLSKLSLHAREGGETVRSQADSALRDNVEDLLEDWELEDPNPDEYTRMLDRMARSGPSLDGDGEDEEAGTGDEDEEEEGEDHPGPLRLVETALEVDAWGPTVRTAVSDLLSEGRVSDVLSLVRQVDGDSEAGRQIRRFVTDPDQLRSLLSGDDVDRASLDTVVEEMGAGAIEPLLDTLVESESRAVRRKVFDRLVALETDLSPRIMERLEDGRWYVVRNMLALIQRLDEAPEGFDPGRFLNHGDHRVRREAFPLAAEDPAIRERALAAGLADEDERLIRMALVELQEGIPETLVPTLVKRVIKGDHPDGLRAMGIRVLRHAESSLAREALMEEAGAGKTLFGRRKVAQKSPAVLAALEALARGWEDHPEAAELLRSARKQGDPAIRDAATPDREVSS